VQLKVASFVEEQVLFAGHGEEAQAVGSQVLEVES
jgi:hypothetical protein